MVSLTRRKEAPLHEAVKDPAECERHEDLPEERHPVAVVEESEAAESPTWKGDDGKVGEVNAVRDGSHPREGLEPLLASRRDVYRPESEEQEGECGCGQCLGRDGRIRDDVVIPGGDLGRLSVGVEERQAD